jgi:hypothetical protein
MMTRATKARAVWAVLVAVCLTRPTLAGAQRWVDPPAFARTEIWAATLNPEPGSSATGRCALLLGWTRTSAVLWCSVTGGSPLVGFDLLVDDLGSTPAMTGIAGSGSFEIAIDALPASVAHALPKGTARFRGRANTGPELSGVFGPANWSRWLMRIFSWNPFSEFQGACGVVTMTDPPLLGFECLHNLPDVSSARFYAGGPEETGPPLLDFGTPVGIPVHGDLVPIDDSMLADLRDGNFYIEIEGGGDALRGDAGCQESETAVCLDNRFRVTAVARGPGEATFARVGRGHNVLSNQENARSVYESLFSFATDRDEWGLRVRMTNACFDGSDSPTWVPSFDLTEWSDDVLVTVADTLRDAVVEEQLGPSNNTRGRSVFGLEGFRCP